MTPRECAEKIYNNYGRKGSWNLFDKKMIDAIESQIREAVEAAIDFTLACNKDDVKEAKLEGWNDAVEAAAKIADGILNGGDIIAQEIRALKPSEKI